MAKLTLTRLLTKGYFPEGIPQAFTTQSFGEVVGKLRTLPAAFKPNADGRIRKSLLARHNFARVGQLRRVFSIPHPVLQFNLAKEIVENWQELKRCTASDSLTMTAIRPSTSSGRATEPSIPFAKRSERRLLDRARGRFVLSADIQQFFPSIYTHSIAWALHTRSTAKARQRDQSLLGNRLDYLVRQAQDSQTRGIPIGPDTSRILAEVILSAVHGDFVKVAGPICGSRAVDDFELIFDDYSKAEEGLTKLQSVLDTWELKLNEEKSRITPLPAVLAELWPATLRHFPVRETVSSQKLDLIEFFNAAFDLAQNNPKSSVLKYAISRTSGLQIYDANWPAYFNLLVQCAMSEPGTLPLVASEIWRYREGGQKIDRSIVTFALDKLIQRHSPLGHGSEVAWSLWLGINLDIRFGKQVTEILPFSTDALVPLLALDARSRGLLKGKLDIRKWSLLMSPDELWGENWLVSYEAAIQGWLPSHGSHDHLRDDPCFAFLRKKNVSFYNSAATPEVLRLFPPRASALGIGITSSSGELADF